MYFRQALFVITFTIMENIVKKKTWSVYVYSVHPKAVLSYFVTLFLSATVLHKHRHLSIIVYLQLSMITYVQAFITLKWEHFCNWKADSN